MVAYINAYKNLFGVEPICRVLRDHNVPIAPSTYYAAKKRQASARQQSDERLLEVIHRVHRENLVCTASVRYGTPSSTRVSTLGVTRWRA